MSSGLLPSESATGWRAPILRHFTPEIAAATRLTIVGDPDQLLTEQVMLGALRARGFDLVPFDDHVAFRFAYESRYRQIWDRGERTNLVVVLRSSSGDLDALPYDLLERARHQERCFSFSVGELFPWLAPTVVLELDRGHFDALFAAQTVDDSVRLGVDATRDFVLRHAFQIAPELIRTPAGLLQVLLRRHYRGLAFPPDLDQRFMWHLKASGRWMDWPLDEIVPNSGAFLTFLEERWPRFVKRAIEPRNDSVGDSAAVYDLRFAGPVDLPFGHDDVKVYIDNLFQEGRLAPACGYRADQVPESWMRVGVAGAEGEDRAVRFERLLKRLETEFPGRDADHRDWIDYARTWAESAALHWELVEAGVDAAPGVWEPVHERIEASFAEWMQRNYASLHNLSSFVRPAMVHHVARHLAHVFVRTGAQPSDSGPLTRHALVVVDGLALDQWVTLRGATLDQLGREVDVEEDGIFAWVPTLTAVSRQAIFAGTEPLFFAGSLDGTGKERRQWTRFWEERGATPAEIGYVREGKNRADDNLLEDVLAAADRPRMRMLAVVIGKIDQSLHGVRTGSGGLHALVRQWGRSGALGRLLGGLIERGFEVALTADHGNVHGRGIGKPDVGAIADERGNRAHVFNDERTRAATARDFPTAIAWPQIGLPENYHALLAPGLTAFVVEGRETIGHGGIAMEEVIVPFVKIRRRTR